MSQAEEVVGLHSLRQQQKTVETVIFKFQEA